MSDELNDVIGRIVEEKTMSLEAVEAIKAMRDGSKRLSETLNQTGKELEESRKEKSTLSGQVTNLKMEIVRWEKRESDLNEREAAVTKLEKDAAVARAESNVFRHCLDTVFKPPTVRREVWQGMTSEYGNEKGRMVNEPTGDHTTTETEE